MNRKIALEWLNAVSKEKAWDMLKRYVTAMEHLWKWVCRAADERPAIE